MIKEIRLEDIIPNPYRNVKDYPTDNTRVEWLANNIKKIGLLQKPSCRISPTHSGKYELAFGQHRFEAVKSLGYETIEVDIKNYTNVQMFQALTGENEIFLLDRSPRFFDEAVEGAKNIIEEHINSKKGVWEDLDEWCQELFDGRTGFHNTILSHKSMAGFGSRFTIGKVVIQNMLGKEWSLSNIGRALQRISEVVTVTAPDVTGGNSNSIQVDISRKALETLEKVDHAESATDVFKSTKGRLAFKTKEDQEKVIEEFHEEVSTNPNFKVTGRSIKEYLNDKADTVLEINTKPVVYKNPYDEEDKAEISVNRKYFKNTYKSFKEETVPVWKMNPYPEHMLHYDRALLLKDILQRLERLKEYDDALGYTSITNTRVYDAIDCDTAEEFKIMKAYLDIENDDYGRLPDVNDWFDTDRSDVIAKCDEILDKYKQKDKFAW